MTATPPDDLYVRERQRAHDLVTTQLATSAPATDIYKQLDSALIQTMAAGPMANSAACRRGCGWCCHQPVYVTGIEAAAIVAHLRAQWPNAWLTQLSALLRQRLQQRATMGGDLAVLRHGMACAFLSEENDCSIHTTRPLACRGHLSANATTCAEFYADPTSPPPPIDAYSHSAAKGQLHGVCSATNQPLIELNMAILTLLGSIDL